MKKKIAFFISSLQGGGAEKVVLEIANNLPQDKYEPTILIHRAKENAPIPSPHVAVVNFNRQKVRKVFFKLVEYLKKEKPDILYSALWYMNFVAIIAVKVARVDTKVVASVHNNPVLMTQNDNFGWIIPFATRFLYNLSDSVVGVSQGVIDELKKLHVREDKLSVIYNPVVSAELKEKSKSSATYRWFGQGYPLICAIGRLSKQKGYPTLLQAMPQILEKYPDAKLLILGEGEDELSLKTMIGELGISESVDLLGFKTNPYAYLSQCDCFVLPSLWEGFGIVIVEAMACGVPVVSTDCPFGPAEIITHEENGLLVEVDNPKLLADAINRVLGDDQLQHKLSENGLKKAEDFTVEKITAEYDDLFTRVLKQ